MQLYDFFFAISKNDIKGVKECLRHTFDINAPSKDWIALHYATVVGHTKIVQLLLEKGAEINKKDSKGMAALHYAASVGHTEIVQLLLGCDSAQVNIKDNQGARALHYAAREGHAQMVQLLLSYNAEVNAKDHKRTTALHYATLENHAEVVKALLSQSADINSQNHQAKTPLDIAIEFNKPKIAQILFEQNKNFKTDDIEALKRKLMRCPLFAIYCLTRQPECFNLPHRDSLALLNTAIEQYSRSETRHIGDVYKGIEIAMQLKHQIYHFIDSSTLLWSKVIKLLFPEKVISNTSFKKLSASELIVMDYIIHLGYSERLKPFLQMRNMLYGLYKTSLPNEMIDMTQKCNYSNEELFQGTLFYLFYEECDLNAARRWLNDFVLHFHKDKREELQGIFETIQLKSSVRQIAHNQEVDCSSSMRP